MKKLTLCLIYFIIHLNSYSQMWTGEENSDWNNPCNWNCWPLDNQKITIDPTNLHGEGCFPEISDASVFIPTMITVQNGATLHIQHNLTVSDDINIFDSLTEVHFQKGELKIGSGGRLIIADGSSLIMKNGILNMKRPLIVEEGGRFIQNGGTLSLEQLAVSDANLPISK